jgi:hypothetical protein
VREVAGCTTDNFYILNEWSLGPTIAAVAMTYARHDARQVTIPATQCAVPRRGIGMPIPYVGNK